MNMNTKELKEYLGYVKNLEARAYEQKKIYNRLCNEVKKLENRQYSAEKRLLKNEGIDALLQSIITFGCLGGVIGLIIGLFIGISMESGFILLKIFNCDIKYLGIGFLIGAIIGAAIAIVWYASEAADTNRKNQDIKNKNIQIAKNNEAMKNSDKRKVQIIKKELEIINKQYQETRNILRRAYQLNVLHPKYQNWIAVCSLHEYLVTERCTQLSGHEGGYNIYEAEVRMNLIISKLDEVIDRLDQIQQSQYELYKALSTSNQNIDKICKQVVSVSNQLGNIEQNQALIEYNSRVTANNTEFLAWLSYFRG